jgi:hypothetical protein
VICTKVAWYRWQKLFSEWAGRCHLPPDALRTWRDVKVNLKLMDMSTFLQLLSTASVIPVIHLSNALHPVVCCITDSLSAHRPY